MLLPQIKQKYLQSFYFYFAKPINEILQDCSLSHVILYKEIQYSLNQVEFLKMYYTRKSKKLSLLLQFYTKHYKPSKPNLSCHKQVKIVDKRYNKLLHQPKINHNTQHSSIYNIYQQSQQQCQTKLKSCKFKLNMVNKLLNESLEDPLYDPNPQLSIQLKSYFNKITQIEKSRLSKLILKSPKNFQIIPRKTNHTINHDYMNTDRRIQTSNNNRISYQSPNTNRSSQSQKSRLESLIQKTKIQDFNRKKIIKLNLQKIMKRVHTKQFI